MFIITGHLLKETYKINENANISYMRPELYWHNISLQSLL